jgi:mannitol/fructose-specific phosphotransferase system IIA component (Ntr-type)
MLTEYLTPDRIRVHVAVDDWEEAVRTAGSLLLEAGTCEPRYIEAMINAVHEMGPYMVLAPGLALAHARPEDGVTDVGMSLITLDPPVDFGAEGKDPISLVIAFGAVDKEKHLDMLQALALFLDDPVRRQRLAEAESVDNILSLIENA